MHAAQSEITPPAPVTATSRVSQFVRREDAWAGALVVALSIAFAWLRIRNVPQYVFTDDFLWGETGVPPLIADRLSRGEALFTDIHSQYGPLSSWLLWMLTLVSGNTPKVYVTYHLLLTTCHLLILYALVRRFLPPPRALLVLVLGIFPYTAVPGSLMGGFVSNAQISLERTLVALGLLVWAPLTRRNSARGAALGIILGLWHLSKFGGAAFLLAAVLILDAIDFLSARREWSALVPVRAFAPIVLGFGAVVAPWIVYCFARMPYPIARDTVFPLYMMQNYSIYPHSAFDLAHGFRFFVGQQMTLLVFIALILFVGARAAWAKRRDGVFSFPAWSHPEAQLALLCLVFLGLCLTRYIITDHHLRTWYWLLTIPGAYAVSLLRPRRLGLVAFSVLCLPCFANAFKDCLVPKAPAADYQERALPTGGSLFLTKEETALLDSILELTNENGSPRRYVFLPGFAGGQYYFSLPRLTRLNYFLPAFFQDYDAERLLRERVDGFILLVNSDPAEEQADLDRTLAWAFPSGFYERLKSKFNPPQRVRPGLFVMRRIVS